MTDKEILKELSVITKAKVHWNTAIDDVAAKLGEQYSADVQAKALWLLGEMGKRLPHSVESYLNGLQNMIRILLFVFTAAAQFA